MYALTNGTSNLDVDHVPGPNEALTIDELTEFFLEVDNQPAWRSQADIEMDYVDGNQLSADIIQKQRAIGMPPAIEPLIGPAIDAVLGIEAKNRADFRIEPDSDNTSEELAKGMGFKLNQAERKSKADRACSDAYRTQVGCGIGWVEVSREPNPFKYPYRCKAIHRNEIWWDWLSEDDDLEDARYLIRRRWTAGNQVKLMFPKHADLVSNCVTSWSGYEYRDGVDGGMTTGLNRAWNVERGWSVEEQQWRDATGKRVCLFECWYRRWTRMLIMKAPDGRVVEVNKKNPRHMAAIAAGYAIPEYAVLPKMRMSIWMGPHCLKDQPTPYRHHRFPYVPFWGKREDRTKVPFGLVRGMIYSQDNVNSVNARLRWGLAARRTKRTVGAVAMTDAQFRQAIARPDADILLNAQHMATPGATFEVERDFELNAQQWQMLEDSRNAISRVAGIAEALQGKSDGAQSGRQQSTMVEQGMQTLGDLNDNFANARSIVGELLLSMQIEDMMGKPEQIMVSGNAIRDDLVVLVNQPKVDEATGESYLDNDLERAMLKVAINDVPSTSSYRAQQLAAMSEAFKAMPPEFQKVAMPYLVALMDLPTDDRMEIIRQVREAAKLPTPDEIQQQIADAVKTARAEDRADLKVQEMAFKYSPDKLKAEITKLIAETFKTNVDAMYAANQTAATIAMNPAIAPVADKVAELSGYQPPNPLGVDPNLPVLNTPAAPVSEGAAPMLGEGPANTSPTAPPVPPGPGSPFVGQGAGSETQRTTDNLPGA